jgi:predicted DNA-binding protein (MmcQ/YjbR family)
VSFTALRKHAQSLPGATIDIKWSGVWVASVGGRMFFAAGPEPGPWASCSFKVDEHRFLELTDLPGLAPAPYLARVKWVQLKDPKALPLAQLKALVSRSHALVMAKLPKKLQRELAGEG